MRPTWIYSANPEATRNILEFTVNPAALIVKPKLSTKKLTAEELISAPVVKSDFSKAKPNKIQKPRKGQF